LRVTKVTGGARSPFGIRKTGIRDQEILIPDIRCLIPENVGSA